MTELASDYEPREAFIPFHQRHHRFAALVCHRRAGKTVAVVNDTIAKAIYTKKKNARYAYIAPFYRQAKDVAWTYLKDYAAPFTKKVRESALRIELLDELGGGWITLYGADNPDALRGLYFDGVVLDEAGDMRPALWSEVVLPTLVDRKGWAVFIGTPKGKNHFYDVYKRSQEDDNWFSMMLKASKSGLINPEDLEEVRAIQDDATYRQEFECDFEAAVKGTYYADLFEQYDVTGTVRYDPMYKVNVAADLGKKDSTAMWFWQEPETDDDFQVIRSHEADGKDLDYYFDYLDAQKYEYGTIWLPHDAVAKKLGSKRSTIEQFLAWADGRFAVRIVPRLSVQHGIDAVRRVLKQCRIDEEECYDGINALRHYKRRYNEVLKVYADNPLHDWASDYADAFRYFALVAQEAAKESKPADAGPLITPPQYKLDELWEDHERNSRQRSRIIRI
jgi:phage terminase large subunit